MPRKRPGFSQLGTEINDSLLAALNDYSARHPEESKACIVSLAIAKYIGAAIPHAELCPPLGRRPKPAGRPPTKPKRKR